MKKILTLLLITIVLIAKPYPLPDLSFDSVEELQSFFFWEKDRIPIISAHRGGPYPGYPENCIETFQNILDHIPSTLEIDISMTLDSVLILMHDWSLDRTTTGTGKIREVKYDDMKELFLEDNDGLKTPYRIPTLKEALVWGKGKTILNLDIKKGVPFSRVVDLIHETGTEASVVIIVYSIEDGLKVNKLDPDLMLSLALRNEDEIRRSIEAGILMDRVTAFTGTHLQKKKLYDTLHDKNIYVNCGTLGNLDKKAATKGDHLYKRWDRLGIDIFATDRPLEVARILYEGD